MRGRRTAAGEPLASALRLLAGRDFSRAELGRRLEAGGFPPGEVEKTLARLEERGHLDDRRLARRLAILLAGEKLLGPRRIEQKLTQRGIPPNLAGEALAQADEILAVGERLRRVLRRKLQGRSPREIPPAEGRRLAHSLSRQGFSWEEIEETFRGEGVFWEP
ncbi:MAG: regulatory protein RecX [Deltaproteobacteria bacterium]|nr:regulatory protein RecX [Deltaproteobacteria bacterium]